MATNAEASTTFPWQSDDWHVSPMNFAPDVIKGFDLPDRVTVSDCTLREGEQQPGVILSKANKVRLARMLDDLGVDEIEVGMPVVSKQEAETATEISALGLNATIVALCRARQEDIDLAAKCGIQRINLSMPSSILQLEKKLRITPEDAIKRSVEMAGYARSLGLGVTFSPYDTTRADLEFLREFILTVEETGHVDRLRVVDTRGSIHPFGLFWLVSTVRSYSKLPIEIHSHNDFGMATANVIGAVAAGASIVSTCMNGMGERAGNAATEEVALSLELLFGVKTNIKLPKIYEVSLEVQRLTKVPLQNHKALVGKTTFTYESGIGVAGLRAGELVVNPYRPSLVGRVPEVILGKKSGKESIKYFLERRGRQLPDDQIHAILQRVKETAEAKESILSDAEFDAIVESVVQGVQS